MSGIGWDDYNDCPLWQFTEEELAERDNQIRADAIDEFANALINDGKVSAMRVLKVMEQLKEQNNGINN